MIILSGTSGLGNSTNYSHGVRARYLGYSVMQEAEGLVALGMLVDHVNFSIPELSKPTDRVPVK